MFNLFALRNLKQRPLCEKAGYRGFNTQLLPACVSTNQRTGKGNCWMAGHRAFGFLGAGIVRREFKIYLEFLYSTRSQGLLKLEERFVVNGKQISIFRKHDES